jgi:hypothetical protein
MAFLPFSQKAQKDWPSEQFSTFQRLSGSSILGQFLEEKKTDFQTLNMFDAKQNEIELWILDDMVWGRGKTKNNFGQEEFFEGPLDSQNYLLNGYGFSISEFDGLYKGNFVDGVRSGAGYR